MINETPETVKGCPLCWDMDSAVCNGCGRGLDVRSQVVRAIREASALNDGSGQFEMSEIGAGYYADAVLAAPGIEVSPRGTVTDALYCAHCQNDDHATYACEASEPEPCSEECGWCGENMPTRPADDVREVADEEHDFTPSTEQVRSHYALDRFDVWRPERGRAFDRWLATEVRPRGTAPAEQTSDPKTIPDDVADEAQLAFHEFVWGAENWPTKRELGITRQAWKCAIAVAFDKMNEK